MPKKYAVQYFYGSFEFERLPNHLECSVLPNEMSRILFLVSTVDTGDLLFNKPVSDF